MLPLDGPQRLFPERAATPIFRTMTGLARSIRRLLADLKRRHVFKSVALYGAGVFALLQVADVVFPAMKLPESAVTWLVALCLAGFPIVLFVAWTFDVSPHGLRRTEVAGSEELEALLAQPRAQRWLAGVLGLTGIGLLMLGSWWVGFRTGGEPPGGAASVTAPPPIESVAVLPFVNFGDPEDEAFSDGLAEELGNALGQIDGLRVAARTSSFAFKGRDVDARTIGRELNVASIVEGSVRRSGGTVRISAQLSRTSDGFRLWSQSWERELTAANVFAIQDEITAEIARALAREIGPDELAAFADRRTSDLEAYDLYLLGRHHWATRESGAVREAIQYYEQAIARDSGFALAWTGLADAWGVLPFYDRTVPGTEAYPQAVRAADRGLALAPDLAEANSARGIIATEYETDLRTGGRLLRRAIRLNPNYAQGHSWLCETLAIGGHDAEALPHCEKAFNLNPVDLVSNLLLTIPLAGMGRTEDALARIERTLKLGPDMTLARFQQAGLLLRLGRTAEAAESLERLARLEGASDTPALRIIATSYPGSTPSSEAIAAVRALERDVGPGLYYLPALYDWAGSEADAIRVVEAGVAALNPWLGLAAVFGEYDGLRENPRFKEILGDLGLPNGNTAYRESRAEGEGGSG